jgi:hypothetical protein
MSGYIYCISNNLLPNIIKVGYVTKKSLIELLNEANSNDNIWNPPSLYYYKYIKEVNDCKSKFNNIKKLLQKYQSNNILQNNFYNVELDDIIIFLDLMDGNEIDINSINKYEQKEEHEEQEEQEEQDNEQEEQEEQQEQEEQDQEQEEQEEQEEQDEKKKKKRKREKKE